MTDNEKFFRENYANLCRFCLKLTKTQSQFNQLIAQLEEMHNLKAMGIEFTTANGLPSIICADCLDFVHRLNEFHRKCLKSLSTLTALQSRLKSEDTNSEYRLLEIVEVTETKSNESGKAKYQNNGRLYRHQCNICGKIIKNLKEHLLTHTPVKSYQCHHCAKLFGDKSNMAKHLRIHFNIRNYACQLCARTFTIGSTLRKHMRTHKDKVPCSLCSRMFKNEKFLSIHLRTHTLDTAYECSACRRCFATEPALISHSRIHDKSRAEPKRKRRLKQIVVVGQRVTINDNK